MQLTRYLALSQEWFRPAQVGAYYDGHRFYLCEDEKHPGRRPARAFVAVSQKCLFFHAFKLPRSLSPEALLSAARLEAQRLFSLLEGRPALDLTCAVLPRRAEEALILFQEKAFFFQVLAELPPGLVPCGVVPAGVAVASYFYQKHRHLLPGVYYFKTAHSYEGVVVGKGQLQGFLPSSFEAAEAFLEGWEGEIFTSEGPAEELLAQGASALPALPSEFLLSFDAFPLRPRPKLSAPLLLVWLFPLLVFFLGQGLRYEAYRLDLKSQELSPKLSSMKHALSEIESFQEKKEDYQKIREIWNKWQGERVDLVMIINRLSQLFPEHTWVRRMEFRAPDELRLWAEGQNALEILKLLDADPLFTEVKFLTTVTKNSRTGKEVFSLVLKIKPKEQ